MYIGVWGKSDWAGKLVFLLWTWMCSMAEVISRTICQKCALPSVVSPQNNRIFHSMFLNPNKFCSWVFYLESLSGSWTLKNFVACLPSAHSPDHNRCCFFPAWRCDYGHVNFSLRGLRNVLYLWTVYLSCPHVFVFHFLWGEDLCGAFVLCTTASGDEAFLYYLSTCNGSRSSFCSQRQVSLACWTPTYSTA